MSNKRDYYEVLGVEKTEKTKKTEKNKEVNEETKKQKCKIKRRFQR